MRKRWITALLSASALSCAALAQAPSGAPGLKAPAAATQKKPAAKASAEEESAGVKAVERIYACMAQGLPKDWGRAWVVVTELAGDSKERSFEGKFFYSLDRAGSKPLPLTPCDAQDVAQRVYALNEFLDYEKRQWKAATLVFTSDGKFELKYDYTK